MTIVAILLAAGESTRMGSPKPLLSWGGTTLIEYQVQQLTAAHVGQIIVVLGHRADEIRSHLDGLNARIVVNQNYQQGRASSVRVGAIAVPDDALAVVSVNVDQPRPAAIIEQLIAAHQTSNKLITLPVYQGQRGHPPVFSGRLLPELRAVNEETQGLREVMRRYADSIQEVTIDDPIVLLNLNTPEDYQEAQRLFFPDF